MTPRDGPRIVLRECGKDCRHASRSPERLPAASITLAFGRPYAKNSSSNPADGVDLCALFPRGNTGAVLRVRDIACTVLETVELPKDSGLHVVPKR